MHSMGYNGVKSYYEEKNFIIISNFNARSNNVLHLM